MHTILIVIHLLVALALVIVILLQRSEGGALQGLGGGGGGGGMGGLMTARGAGNVLTRVTAILATIFMLTSITLTIISRPQTATKKSILDAPAAQTETVDETVPAAPVAPVAETDDAPAEPSAPAAPVATE